MLFLLFHILYFKFYFVLTQVNSFCLAENHHQADVSFV